MTWREIKRIIEEDCEISDDDEIEHIDIAYNDEILYVTNIDGKRPFTITN